MEVYRAEVVEYENTDRSWIHKYGSRIRGSESLSRSGSLIRTRTTLHNRKIMDIIQLKHSGINTTKYRFLPFYQTGVIKITWCEEMECRNFICGYFGWSKNTILHSVAAAQNVRTVMELWSITMRLQIIIDIIGSTLSPYYHGRKKNLYHKSKCVSEKTGTSEHF